MKKNTKISPNKGIADFIKRSNLVIFITIVVCMLIFAIISLSNLLTPPTITTQQPTSTITTSNTNSFDQATIESLNKLSPADSNNPVIPSGRIDPFSE